MAQVTDCISHMIKAMDARPDVVGATCEALHKMFEKNHTELVSQVNKNSYLRYITTYVKGDNKLVSKIKNGWCYRVLWQLVPQQLEELMTH